MWPLIGLGCPFGSWLSLRLVYLLRCADRSTRDPFLESLTFLVDITTPEIALAFCKSGSAQLGARSGLRVASDQPLGGLWIPAVMAFSESLPWTRQLGATFCQSILTALSYLFHPLLSQNTPPIVRDFVISFIQHGSHPQRSTVFQIRSSAGLRAPAVLCPQRRDHRQHHQHYTRRSRLTAHSLLESGHCTTAKLPPILSFCLPRRLQQSSLLGA